MLSLQNLSDQTSSTPLHHISFEINERDFFVIYGPDGSGKSSLLRHILCEETAGEGQIYYRETDVHYLSRSQQKEIQYVPNVTPDLSDKKGLSCLEYLVRAKKQARGSEGLSPEKVLDYFNLIPSTALADLSVSDGKLMLILAALCAGPDFLILDEPYNYLNDRSFHMLMALLKVLNEDGLTILLTATSFEEVNGYVNHALYLRDGYVITSFACDTKLPMVKLVTLEGGDPELLEAQLGAPVSCTADFRSYLCNAEPEELSQILSSCHAEESNVLIELRSIEEVLEMHYYKK